MNLFGQDILRSTLRFVQSLSNSCKGVREQIIGLGTEQPKTAAILVCGPITAVFTDVFNATSSSLFNNTITPHDVLDAVLDGGFEKSAPH